MEEEKFNTLKKLKTTSMWAEPTVEVEFPREWFEKIIKFIRSSFGFIISAKEIILDPETKRFLEFLLWPKKKLLRPNKKNF